MKYIPNNNIFIDSNIWIYLSLKKENNLKYNKIISFFENNLNLSFFTSIQVINEFHWVLLRKYKIPENQITEKIENGIINICKICDLSLSNYYKAKEIRNKFTISFWDSLIISSAILSNCSIIYSEDMQNNLVIENKVKILNPFFNEFLP
jgi:predicted nucleic acid-binding protein